MNYINTIYGLFIVAIVTLLLWIKKISDAHKGLKCFVFPPGNLIFTHLHLLDNKTILHNLQDYVQKYGGLLRLEIVYGKDALIVTDKDFISVLLKSTTILNKNEIYRHTRKWLGTGLLTSDRTKWEKQRKIISPAFRIQILEDYVDLFHASTDIFIKKLTQEISEEGIDIVPLLRLCTLDIICETAMGSKIQAQQHKCPDYVDCIKEECKILLDRNKSLYKHFDMLYFFSKDYWKERKTLKILQSFTRDILHKRKQEYLNRDTHESHEIKKHLSFLDLLLEYNQDSMSDEDIAEEVDTFMFAGHDTTASGISFALHCLSTYPDIQKKLWDEQNLIFGHDDRLPTYKDLQDMKYLEMVIKESLRLYPPVPFIGRQPTKDFTYGDSVIPKDSSIIIFTYGLHRNPIYFQNPEEFHPERFETPVEPFTYIPFSAGIRNCIGQRFAMLEMKYIITRILKEFELHSPTGFSPKLLPEIVLTASNGIKVILKKRIK